MKESRMILASVPCNLCEKNPEVLYDAPTRSGQWAYMCESCLRVNGGMNGPGTKHRNRPVEQKAGTGQELTFDAWMSATDRIFEMKVGLDIDSILGDWNSRDMYDDGMSPSNAAKELMENVRAEYGSEYI